MDVQIDPQADVEKGTVHINNGAKHDEITEADTSADGNANGETPRDDGGGKPTLHSPLELQPLPNHYRRYSYEFDFRQINAHVMFLVMVLFIAALLLIPVVVARVTGPGRRASIGGVPLLNFFLWIEISWLCFGVPGVIFMAVAYLTHGTDSKVLLLLTGISGAVDLSLTVLGSLISFYPVIHKQILDPQVNRFEEHHWQAVLHKVILAGFCCSLVRVAKAVLVKGVRIWYNDRQFSSRMTRAEMDFYSLLNLQSIVYNLVPPFNRDALLPYDRVLLPDCEDLAVISPESYMSYRNAILDPKNTEALARRIWHTFAEPGKDSIALGDVERAMDPLARNENLAKAMEVLETQNSKEFSYHCEPHVLFALLDPDSNGAVTEQEVVTAVLDHYEEDKNLLQGVRDIHGIFDTIDWILFFFSLLISIFIYIAFFTDSIENIFAFAGTLTAGAAFAFSGTIQDLMASMFFVISKHPFDVGDRVKFDGREYIVREMHLLYSTFLDLSERDKLVQISNGVLTDKPIQNISRSDHSWKSYLDEVIRFDINFSTSFDDIERLRNEISAFVKENSREYLPDHLDVQSQGLGLEKLELKVEVRYKGNWRVAQNIQTARRERFLRKLVEILRDIPICGPGSSAVPKVGTAGNVF